MFRYDSRAGAGPMHTSSSAKRTWSDSRSASEYTATARRRAAAGANDAQRDLAAIGDQHLIRHLFFSNDDHEESLVPATPWTRSANSDGLVA